MRDIRHVINHRCNELLKYDNNNFKPCAIHFDKWLLDEDRTWILKICGILLKFHIVHSAEKNLKFL